MNKRIHKKKMKFIIDNIQQVKLNENEFLIFRFDENKWKPDYMKLFAQYIKENVSNKVFFVPKDIEMIKGTEL